MDSDRTPVAKIWPVEFWSKHDVSVWLSSIDMKKYNQQLRKHDVCGRSLMLLTEEDLKQMGIDSLGDRKALLYEIKRLDKWDGFLWRTELTEENTGEIITLELIMSLAPNHMSAICTVRNASGAEDIPAIKVKWIFSQGNTSEHDDVIERFSTSALYDTKQSRSIIRLPCPVSDAEVEVELA